MAIIKDFSCKCCHQRKDGKEQVNSSGYCIQCYGHCILADHNRCDVVKTKETKFKMSDKGFPIVDGAPEMPDTEWLTFEGE